MKPGSQLYPGPNLNASNTYMGNKPEELQKHIHLQGYDLIVMEMWWNGCCGMQGYRLFRKDRQRGGVAFPVNDQMESMEFHLGMDEQQPESSWVRIKGRAGIGDIIVGVQGRPLNRRLKF